LVSSHKGSKEKGGRKGRETSKPRRNRRRGRRRSSRRRGHIPKITHSNSFKTNIAKTSF
jgi:hypothetical protein